MPRILFSLLGEWIHAINLDDGRTLCQVRSDNDLRKVSEKYVSSPVRCEPEQS